VSRRVPREPLTASRRAGYPCAPYLTHHSKRTPGTYRLSEEVLSYTLKGFPEAITSVFPRAVVQTCIVHLIRYSMHFASWKERRPVALALKPIYQAEAATVARGRLEDFDRGPWGQKYPAIAQSWRRNWEQVIPFFAFAPELRKILYTTNAIESLNAQVRKAVRVRGHFPSEEAATKLIWLVLRNVQARWKNPPISWHAAKAQLAIQFEERFLLTD
jgi:putative transposase